MKCCVPSCGVTSSKHPSSVLHDHERATFQEFPTMRWLKKAWLERLEKIGIKECDLPQGAVICSQHFVKDDFFAIRMGSGIMKLRQNSVPSVFKSNTEPSTFEFCLICLDPDPSKLYVLKENRLAQAYTNLTGLQMGVVRDHIKTVPKLCPECAQRLTNCEAFKLKTIRAHDVLIKLLQKDKIITAGSIKSVNRVENSLISNMVKQTIKPDFCDLRLVHNEGHSDVQQEDKEERELTDEVMSESEENATDYEIDCLNDIEDTYNDQIIKRHEFNDDDDDSSADKGENNKGDSNIELDIMDVDIERDPDDVDDDSKRDSDVDDDSKRDNDVDGDSKHDKDTDDYISNEIDIEIDNIDKLLNKKYINKSLLNKLKAANNSKNRVSLANVIFVKDAKPIINHKDNTNLNLNTEINKTERKNITNKNNNKLRKEEKQKEKIKTRKDVKGTNNQQYEDTIIIEEETITVLNNNDGRRDDNEKSIITRSKSKNLSQVMKKNENVSKSIKVHDNSGTELKFFTRTKLTYEEQIDDVEKRKDTLGYKSSPYKCDVCFKGFWKITSYNLHMDKHTNSHTAKRPAYKCSICDKTFTTVVGRDSHVSHVHHKLPRPKYYRGRSKPMTRRHSGDTSASRDTNETSVEEE